MHWQKLLMHGSTEGQHEGEPRGRLAEQGRLGTWLESTVNLGQSPDGEPPYFETCKSPEICIPHAHLMATMHTGRASGLAAADGQPPAHGVHRQHRGTENSHPARTRHACGHWANPQPRCTLKLTAMRRDPRPCRRHVQRDPCRGLHITPTPRPASSKRHRDPRRAHMPQSEPSVKSILPYPK
jgi:hypothetical protein